jgi:hypothetical protein
MQNRSPIPPPIRIDEHHCQLRASFLDRPGQELAEGPSIQQVASLVVPAAQAKRTEEIHGLTRNRPFAGNAASEKGVRWSQVNVT